MVGPNVRGISHDETQQEPNLLCGRSRLPAGVSNRGFETIIFKKKVCPLVTMIRENPSKYYWKYIYQPFRRQFTKKVLIMGSANRERPL